MISDNFFSRSVRLGSASANGCETTADISGFTKLAQNDSCAPSTAEEPICIQSVWAKKISEVGAGQCHFEFIVCVKYSAKVYADAIAKSGQDHGEIYFGDKYTAAILQPINYGTDIDGKDIVETYAGFNMTFENSIDTIAIGVGYGPSGTRVIWDSIDIYGLQNLCLANVDGPPYVRVEHDCNKCTVIVGGGFKKAQWSLKMY